MVKKKKFFFHQNSGRGEITGKNRERTFRGEGDICVLIRTGTERVGALCQNP